MFVRYEVTVDVPGATESPGIVVVWSRQAASEWSKLRLATRAAAVLGAAVTGPRLGRLCPRCGSDGHGRPYFVGRPDLAVSLSATAGATAAAVTRGVPVGLDVEYLDEVRFADVAGVLLHPEEEVSDVTDLARAWVRKESLLKALGVGLDIDPRTVHLRAAGTPAVIHGPLPGGGTSSLWLEDLALAPLMLGSVAVLAPQRPVVTVMEAAPEELLS